MFARPGKKFNKHEILKLIRNLQEDIENDADAWGEFAEVESAYHALEILKVKVEKL